MHALWDWLAATDTTRTQLAKRLGVSQTALTYWLNGNRTPRPPYARKIAKLTGLTLDQIYATRR